MPSPYAPSVSYERIQYEAEDGILTLALNRSDKLNAFTSRMAGGPSARGPAPGESGRRGVPGQPAAVASAAVAQYV